MSEPVRSVKDMIIECELCEANPDVHHDCVVAFLTDPARQGASVQMDADQAAAVEFMVKGGLIPPLRLVPPLAPQAPQQPAHPIRAGHVQRVS